MLISLKFQIIDLISNQTGHAVESDIPKVLKMRFLAIAIQKLWPEQTDPTKIITCPHTPMVIKKISNQNLNDVNLLDCSYAFIKFHSKLQKRHRIEIYKNSKKFTKEITAYLVRVVFPLM